MAVTRTENVVQFTADSDSVSGEFIVEAVHVEGWAKSAHPDVELRELSTNGILFKTTLADSGGAVLNRHFPLQLVTINADGFRLNITSGDWFWIYVRVYYR